MSDIRDTINGYSRIIYYLNSTDLPGLTISEIHEGQFEKGKMSGGYGRNFMEDYTFVGFYKDGELNGKGIEWKYGEEN